VRGISTREAHRSRSKQPAPKNYFLSRFQRATPCPALPAKIFFFRFFRIYVSITPSRLGKRGVSADRHDTWGGDAMDVKAPADDRHRHGRRSRVVLIPRRWYQIRDEASLRADDGGQKARRTREITYKS
jgi:hypothetical protein